MATRLALCCVCDHEQFMSFDIASFRNSILNVLRLWESFRHHVICLETQELVSPTTLSVKSFLGPRCLATVLVLL